jgi:hypothetical protein
LETPPNGSIEQLGVVRRCDDYNVAGQLVELHQKERYDALDLAGLMDVAALFSDGVEFVEEEHAGRRPGLVE